MTLNTLLVPAGVNLNDLSATSFYEDTTSGSHFISSDVLLSIPKEYCHSLDVVNFVESLDFNETDFKKVDDLVRKTYASILDGSHPTATGDRNKDIENFVKNILPTLQVHRSDGLSLTHIGLTNKAWQNILTEKYNAPTRGVFIQLHGDGIDTQSSLTLKKLNKPGVFCAAIELVETLSPTPQSILERLARQYPTDTPWVAVSQEMKNRFTKTNITVARFNGKDVDMSTTSVKNNTVTGRFFSTITDKFFGSTGKENTIGSTIAAWRDIVIDDVHKVFDLNDTYQQQEQKSFAQQSYANDMFAAACRLRRNVNRVQSLTSVNSREKYHVELMQKLDHPICALNVENETSARFLQSSLTTRFADMDPVMKDFIISQGRALKNAHLV